MNKLFWILVILCFLGAAGLYWVLNSVDNNQELPTKTIPSDQMNSEVEKDAENAVPTENEEIDGAFYLELFTEPAGADVFLNDEFRGKTPLKFNLEDKGMSMIVRNEGYEDYQREVPASSDVEGDLIWKIQMRAFTPEELKSAQEKKINVSQSVDISNTQKIEDKPVEQVAADTKTAEDKKVKNELKFKRGELSGHFIQMKAVALDEFAGLANEEVDSWFQSDEIPFGCRVDLGAKGKWVRVLVGPYESPLLARSTLVKNKNQLPVDSFVSGGQKCL